VVTDGTKAIVSVTIALCIAFVLWAVIVTLSGYLLMMGAQWAAG